MYIAIYVLLYIAIYVLLCIAIYVLLYIANKKLLIMFYFHVEINICYSRGIGYMQVATVIYLTMQTRVLTKILHFIPLIK